MPHELMYVQDTLRQAAPSATLAFLKPKLASFGITRVANISGLDDLGVFVTNCIRPNAKHLSVSQGKGLSLVQAEISGIMEAIEGYHIENPKASELYGAYTELKAHYSLVAPEVFSRTLFHKNLSQEPLAWARAYNYETQASCYVPHILTCIDTTQIRKEYTLFNVSSNGLAAGNSFDEALSHALLEVIEREALFHWQTLASEEKNKRQIAIPSIDDSNATLIENLLQRGIAVKVWDITSEIGIPAFHCVVIDNNPIRNLRLFTGTCAHLSKTMALSKAITEALQGRLAFISGSRDDVFEDYYLKLKLDFLHHSTQVATGLKPYTKVASPSLPDSTASILASVRQHLQAAGFTEIIIVDHTRVEWGVPVVQVFVPGLRLNNARM